MIISFPNLNLSFDINPVAFNFFGRGVYWYGLIMGLAMICSVVFLIYNAKKNTLESDFVVNSLPYIFVCGIIGARLYYILGSIGEYIEKPWEIIAIWHGGIAIYGAIIGGGLGLYYFCKKSKMDYIYILDIYIPSLILGQAIGRWGNFFNGEAFGIATGGRFEMIIERGKDIRIASPTFLYESIACLIGFVLLIILPKIFKKFYEKRGNVFYTYLVLYGIARFFIEGLRTDSLPKGAPFKISQILSCVIVLFGIFMLYKNRNNQDLDKAKKPS